MTDQLPDDELARMRAADRKWSRRSGESYPCAIDRSLLIIEVDRLRAEVERLRAQINSPHTRDFLESVRIEAVHQRERWGTEHDDGKGPTDWFWLLGYLAGKAVWAATHGDREKALHHTISSAAMLLNWHAAISGVDRRMRPGIDASKAGEGR